MSLINLKLPQPRPNLEAKIWARLELEQNFLNKTGRKIWLNWLVPGFVTVLIVFLISTKLFMGQIKQNQFNDLETELTLVASSSSLDLINLEWASNPPESN